jgi:hypothetical protein
MVSGDVILCWSLCLFAWLSLTVWVTLPTPSSSSVQRPSIQFYTRPHLSVNLSVPFFPRDIPLGAAHLTAPIGSWCSPSSNTAVIRDFPLLLSWAAVLVPTSCLHLSGFTPLFWWSTSSDMFLTKRALEAISWYLCSLKKCLLFCSLGW